MDRQTFTLEALYLVTGYKYNDVNNNGVIDDGDATVSGWTITATNDGRTVTAQTNARGYYALRLPEGVWTISEENRSNWVMVGAFGDDDSDFALPFVSDAILPLMLVLSEESVATSCNVYVGGKRVYIHDEGEGAVFGPTCDFLNRQIEEVRSSSGGTKVGVRQTAGRVLGAAASTGTSTVAAVSAPVCEGLYLGSYMRLGQENGASDVLKLQVFLNAIGMKVALTGVFDAETDAVVRAFQVKYLPAVLAPWGITEPTGYVYKTTRAAINNMVCPGSEVLPTV